MIQPYSLRSFLLQLCEQTLVGRVGELPARNSGQRELLDYNSQDALGTSKRAGDRGEGGREIPPRCAAAATQSPTLQPLRESGSKRAEVG